MVGVQAAWAGEPCGAIAYSYNILQYRASDERARALHVARRPVENHKVNAELIFAAIHAKRFDSESDIQVQVRAWIFHFDCFFDSD